MFPVFLKGVERQLDDDRRDHAQKTGGSEEDECGDQEDADHETGLEF